MIFYVYKIDPISPNMTFILFVINVLKKYLFMNK